MAQSSRSLRLLQRGDEVGQRPVVHPASGLGGRDGKADGQVGLSDARWPEEHHVLLTLQEAEFMKTVDLLSLDGGLEGEVEVLEGFDNRQPGGAHGGLKTPVVPEGDLGSQELLNGLRGCHTSTVDAGEDLVQGLQRTGQLEVGQHVSDLIAARTTRWCLHEGPPASWAYTWSGRRSTVIRGTEGRDDCCVAFGGLSTRESIRPRGQGKQFGLFPLEPIQGSFFEGTMLPDVGHGLKPVLGLMVQILNHQAEHWLDTVANVREHGTLKERPLDRFQRERSELLPLATRPYHSLVLGSPKATPVRSRPSVPRVEVQRRPLQVYAEMAGGAR